MAVSRAAPDPSSECCCRPPGRRITSETWGRILEHGSFDRFLRRRRRLQARHLLLGWCGTRFGDGAVQLPLRGTRADGWRDTSSMRSPRTRCAVTSARAPGPGRSSVLTKRVRTRHAEGNNRATSRSSNLGRNSGSTLHSSDSLPHNDQAPASGNGGCNPARLAFWLATSLSFTNFCSAPVRCA